MKPWYAYNARKLLEVREGGQKPEGTVYVSMADTDIYGALTVKPDMPVDRLDWRMLVNLDVLILAGPSAPVGWLVDSTSRIAHARPNTLGIRFDHDDLHDVEVGTGLHLPVVRDLPGEHSFTWVPINCSGTQTGARLRRALIAKHPRWTIL